MRRPLIAGNWKLQGHKSDLAWASELRDQFSAAPEAEIAICPPNPWLISMAEAGPDWLLVGAQDCSAHERGAHTGEVAASMLAEAGCQYVIVGHSERRSDHGETNAIVREKAQRVLSAGMTPIICLGESLKDRDDGKAEDICRTQLVGSLPEAAARKIVLAYEPVWAIGTGRTATAEQAQAMHKTLRSSFRGSDREDLRILYGGSVKPDNAASLLSQPDIDGALVGGASLKAQSFADIIRAVG